MRHWPRALLVSAALTALSCSQREPVAAREGGSSSTAAPAAAPIAAVPRIVFLGDSLTAGYGLDIEQSVPSLVQKQLEAEGYKYEVVNAGVSGDTSEIGRAHV